MNVDHRRALFAFFVVACVCALLIGQGVRPSSDFFDYIVGRSATPPTVADTVTLEPRDDDAAPRPEGRESAPTDEGSEAVVDVAASPSAAGGSGDSRPGKAPNHASAPDRGHSAGGGHSAGNGKPSHAGGKADRPSGKHQRQARASGDDTGGADGNKRDRGKKKGHRKDRPGNQGRGRTAH